MSRFGELILGGLGTRSGLGRCFHYLGEASARRDAEIEANAHQGGHKGRYQSHEEDVVDIVLGWQ